MSDKSDTTAKALIELMVTLLGPDKTWDALSDEGRSWVAGQSMKRRHDDAR